MCRAAQNKIADDVSTADRSSKVNVIVQYREAPGKSHHEHVRVRGGSHKASLGLIKAAVYSASMDAIESLAAMPEVVRISPDRRVYPMLDYTSVSTAAELALSAGFDGRGIGIAVIDSGINPHPDLMNSAGRSRVLGRLNFVPGTGQTRDAYGHGTQVAGILAGNGSASALPGATRVFRGIAPAAHLVSFRVLDGDGGGTDSAVIAAIEAAIKLKDKYNLRVMTLSLGRAVSEGYETDPLCQAVEKARRAGIVVVVAAGNGGRNRSAGTDGYATITAPGNDPLVITVGAMKAMDSEARGDDLIASYSSKGPTLLDHIRVVARSDRFFAIQGGRDVQVSRAHGEDVVLPDEHFPGLWVGGDTRARKALGGGPHQARLDSIRRQRLVFL